MTQANTKNNFIISMSLIFPIEDIINKLNNSEFRDCDIKWLDNKLFSFTDLACKTLGMDITTPINEQYTVFNDFVKNKYIGYFKTLLQYFKQYVSN
jgi:hypothetical protein